MFAHAAPNCVSKKPKIIPYNSNPENMNMRNNQIVIEIVANGFIVELPSTKANEIDSVMKSVMQSVRKLDNDPALDTDEDNHVTNDLVDIQSVADKETHVFKTWEEVIGFLKYIVAEPRK